MTMARYLKSAIADGSLRSTSPSQRALQDAARVTLAAVDTHLGRPRLTPFGGLYTVVDIGTDADEFVPKALKATGVLVVPGGGFGESLTNGVRISFGPLVTTPRSITRAWAPRRLDADLGRPNAAGADQPKPSYISAHADERRPAGRLRSRPGLG